MKPQRLMKWGCLTAGVACLAAGYVSVGQWGFLALAGLAWLAGVLFSGWSLEVFVGLAGLAAAGVCAGAQPPLMILGATLALASWDLASWEAFVADGLPADTIARVGWRHYVCLASALGSGLLAAITGRLVSFQIPFGVLAGLTVLLLLGIDQIWRFVERKSRLN